MDRSRSASAEKARRRLLGVAILALLTSCYSWVGRYQTIDGRVPTATQPYVDWTGRRFWYVDISARNEGGTTEGAPTGAAPSKLAARREDYVRDLFKCAPPAPVIAPFAGLTALERPGGPRVDLDGATKGALVFRIGFISDVHIRQPSVKLFSDEVSRSLDYLINSFERNGYQEAFQTAVFAATVAAFNQLSSDDKPRLIVNTGDATDAGTIEEAYDFASVMHHLRYPMLYAIGNHDDAIFGNYKDDLGYTKDAGPTFYPVGQKARFLEFFNQVPTIAGFNEQRIPLPVDYPSDQINRRWGVLDFKRENDPVAEAEHPANLCAPVAPTTGGAAPAPPCQKVTRCSGFDLDPTVPVVPGQWPRCDKSRGYYSVVVPGSDRDPQAPATKVQLIALNTTREQSWGQGAALDDDQRKWLDGELRKDATVTILFMHHRPSEVPGLMPVLNANAWRRPMVVLSAHDHSYTTAWLGHLWELNTGSLEEFPQWGQLVEIRKSGGRYYLNARTIRPQLPVLANPPDVTGIGVPAGTYPDYWDTSGAIDLGPLDLRGNPDAINSRAARLLKMRRLEAWFESKFVHCDEIASRPPGQCAGGSPNALQESAECGYLGALYDHLVVNKTHQSGAAASGQANIAIDISP